MERRVNGGGTTTPLSPVPGPPPSDCESGEFRPPKQLKWFCVDLTHWSTNYQKLFLFFGILICFILNSWIEEYLFAVFPNFQYGLYMTFFELLCFSVIAIVERTLMGETLVHHNASLNQHGIVAGIMTLSRGLTNVSLQYLNYPTQVIFKSMKLITVMIGSIVLLGRKFPASDYISAVNLVASAIFFSLGDADVSPRYTTTGLVIVCVSLVFDSLHANWQDSLMHDHHATESEVLLFTNFFAAIVTLVAVIGKGELVEAFVYCFEQPLSYFFFILRGLALYMGTRTYLCVVGAFGAYSATTMTTVRKVVTVLLSFVLISKPWTPKYLFGLGFFGLGLYFGMRKSAPKPPPQAQVETRASV